MPTVKLPSAIAPALMMSTRPKPTSAAPWLNANTLSLSTRSRTAVSPRRLTRASSRASRFSAAPLTLTVVAAAIMSPTSPVTCPVAVAVGRSISLDPAVGEAGHQHDADHRQQQHRRRPGVGHAEDDSRGDAEHEAGGNVDDTVDQPRDVLDVVAEVGQRLARRADRLARLWSAARHLRLEQVGPQQRLHVHPRLRPRDRRVVDHRHAHQLGDAEHGGVAIHRRGVALVERFEAAPEDVAAEHGQREEHDE